MLMFVMAGLPIIGKILNWIFNEEIDANINKIKIYGGQFGDLLPKLQF